MKNDVHDRELGSATLEETLARIRAHVEAVVPGSGAARQGRPGIQGGVDAADSPDVDVTPEVERLADAFGLSSFERDLLLLCAGAELDREFAGACARAQGGVQTAPTFSLAMAALPDAHWSAIAPTGPLREFHLIELGGAGEPFTTAPLRIDERVLHYLVGAETLDVRLRALVRHVPVPGALPSSHTQVADDVAAIWRAVESGWPGAQLCGSDDAALDAVAAAACGAVGLDLFLLRAANVPAHAAERELLARIWEREAILSDAALLVTCDPLDAPEVTRAAAAFVETLDAFVLIAGRDPLPLRGRSLPRFDVPVPTAAEQHDLWRAALGDAFEPLHDTVDRLAGQFRLGPRAIASACAAVPRGAAPGDAAERLWTAARQQVRAGLDALAQRIEPKATWPDLVLPAPQLQILQDVAVHARNRTTVYEEWGFGARGERGLGITALFEGSSGTGKTFAAEVLASFLGLNLYRIDLSAVVNKYIGETEKNLRRVFDAAESGGAVLLFDEADALFGKRSEVRDSHDRYANIEVSYLLQRMEAYRGLAILTTNMKHALDQAFLRRIRFVVQFPFPDAAGRLEIWRRIFPRETPTEGLDLEALARLSVAGGTIRNIALQAAFLAADASQPVRMAHVMAAARREYGKLERPFTASEGGGFLQ
jgi:vesicle-fusing ATPase